MFKKPNRNFRARKNRDSESGDDYGGPGGGDNIESEENAPIILPASTYKKKKKKGSEGPIKATSKLSFGDDENEETIKIKKSSRSKHIAKQLKKESRREQEEQAKREALERAQLQEEQQLHKNGSSTQEDMEIDEDDNDRVNNCAPEEESISQRLPKNQSQSPSHTRSESDDSEEEEREAERKKRLSLDKIFKDGGIPDAHLIHMARKRRQAAREHGDFIPIEDKERQNDSGSRLIREEDHDHSDDDDEPLSFSVDSREKQLRKMQETILTAQEGHNSEESDQEREWELQQIRKGVSIPQVVTNEGKSSNTLLPGPGSFNSYMYSPSTNIFKANAPEMTATSVQTLRTLSDVPITLDSVKKNLKDRLDSLTSVHRAHMNEREDIIDRLKTCEESISKCESSQGGLEEQYRFFQEMRGYVRDLVECLNEKVPSINYLERRMNHRLMSRAENLVKRRHDDLKDQSEDIRVQQNLNMPPPSVQPEKQRRIAEREARRSRRRRKRDADGIKDHHEGLSTDEEESKADVSAFKKAKEQIDHDCRTMFEDVNDEFCNLEEIRRRFEEWKFRYGASYNEAYIGLCLPKLFTPFVKLQLVTWNPIEDENAVDFESMAWYESLMFYGHRKDEQLNASDPDIKLIPTLIEKVLLPKLTERVEKVWDPLSSNQTLRLSSVAKQFIRDYPTINAESKNTQNFLGMLVHRLRKTLNDDVFIPLCTRQMMENKNSPAYIFSQRQFWTCIKLLTNLMVWHGMISDKVLKEMTLDSLLNRYLLLALQTSLQTQATPDILYKAQAVVCCLPKPWFVDINTDSTLPEFNMLCRFLNTFADTLGDKATAGADAERKEARDNLRQITKMFVSIHAMDHALALTEKFSFKM